MEQPEHFIEPGTEGKVCLLRRALYGLKQAGHAWYEKLDGELLNLGLKRSGYVSCLYYKREGEEIILVALYINNIII